MKLLARIHPLVWFGLASVIIIAAGVYFINQLNKPSSSGSNLLGELQKDDGRQHIVEGSPAPAYSSNPPTSGPHYPAPANVGIYDSQLPDQRIIHNLEHGHVWISYRPDLGEDQIAKLKEIVGKKPRMLVMTPRTANDSAIALASWHRLLKLDTIDEKQIKDFIKTNRGRAPEFIP